MPIVSYQQAEAFFNKTNKPPRSKKYEENQRPLRRVSESHLMIQKDPQSYVIKVCGVETARYLKPESPDKFQIAVRGMRNTYESDIAYKFTGLYNGIALDTTDGVKACVPLNPRYADQGQRDLKGHPDPECEAIWQQRQRRDQQHRHLVLHQSVRGEGRDVLRSLRGCVPLP